MKSLLYHGFGVKGYRYLATRYQKGEIIFEIEPEDKPPARAGEQWVAHGCRWRKVRTLSIGMKPVWLKVRIPRWQDKVSGKEVEQLPPFCDPYRKITRPLERLINDLARFMTLLDVALWLQLSWSTIKDVVKRRLEKEYKQIAYRGVKRIGIDELYLGKKQKFLTLVTDLDSGRIIWVGQGRGAEALREFWRRFKASRARLEAVAMDMSGPYAQSVREQAPDANLTFDRFHVIKLMNERLDDLRRELVRESESAPEGQAIKGLRWLLLTRASKLEASAKEKLDAALALNRPLSIAYIMKEELGLIWQQADGRKAWNYLQTWCAKAKASGIRQLLAMAKTLKRHARGILSFYKTRITSGMVEGINRKIRTLLSAAYGLRDTDFLTLRLYALHESKVAFIG